MFIKYINVDIKNKYIFPVFYDVLSEKQSWRQSSLYGIKRNSLAVNYNVNLSLYQEKRMASYLKPSGMAGHSEYRCINL